jgi:tRNA (cytidine32/uridine32-2'-O)-methyltransferase
MKNMGLGALHLVEPPEQVRGEEARSQAWQAWEVLEGAREWGSLAQAVASATLVVGTSGKAEGTLSPRRFVQEPGAQGVRIALVFGPESSGLTAHELSLCHRVLRIPTHPAQPSLNLAHAVLIVAYEVFLSGGSVSEGEAPTPRATAGELERTLDALSEGLIGIGYLPPEKPSKILGEIRQLLVRAAVTPRDLTLLRGIARQASWAAKEIARARDRKP